MDKRQKDIILFERKRTKPLIQRVAGGESEACGLRESELDPDKIHAI